MHVRLVQDNVNLASPTIVVLLLKISEASRVTTFVPHIITAKSARIEESTFARITVCSSRDPSTTSVPHGIHNLPYIYTMAIVQPVDVSTLTKWEDAFQQPVANVRVMERQLRGSLDVNREKLRTLVGFVYQIYFSQDIVDLEQNETIREEHEWLTDSLRFCYN